MGLIGSCLARNPSARQVCDGASLHAHQVHATHPPENRKRWFARSPNSGKRPICQTYWSF